MSNIERLEATQVVVAVLGQVGSDGGYWVLTPNGPVKVGGWGAAEMREFGAAMKAIAAATTLDNERLRTRISASVTPFVTAEAQRVAQAITEGLAAEDLGSDTRAAPTVMLVMNS